nr:hypothetical protein [Tanacetum cinerariifolium]
MTERNSQSIIPEQQQASPGRSPIETALGVGIVLQGFGGNSGWEDVQYCLFKTYSLIKRGWKSELSTIIEMLPSFQPLDATIVYYQPALKFIDTEQFNNYLTQQIIIFSFIVLVLIVMATYKSESDVHAVRHDNGLKVNLPMAYL